MNIRNRITDIAALTLVIKGPDGPWQWLRSSYSCITPNRIPWRHGSRPWPYKTNTGWMDKLFWPAQQTDRGEELDHCSTTRTAFANIKSDSRLELSFQHPVKNFPRKSVQWETLAFACCTGSSTLLAPLPMFLVPLSANTHSHTPVLCAQTPYKVYTTLWWWLIQWLHG